MTAYALSFGSLLLFCGRLADLIGRQATFLTGLAGFAAASAVGGASDSFTAMNVVIRGCPVGAQVAWRHSWAVLGFGLGQAPGEFIEVASADQPALGGMIRWRQRPVIPGGVAAPDPPPRVPAPEPVEPAVPVGRVLAGGHR